MTVSRQFRTSWITWSRGALVMIILIIKMILSDYQIIIVHIIILLDHLVSWRHGHLLDDQDSQNIVDMTIETATKMVTMRMVTIMMILLTKMTTLRHLLH